MLGQAALLICLLIVGTEAQEKVKTTLKYQSACFCPLLKNLLTIRKFQNVEKFQILVFLCIILFSFDTTIFELT